VGKRQTDRGAASHAATNQSHPRQAEMIEYGHQVPEQ